MSGFSIALLIVRLYGAICIVTGAGFLLLTIFVALPVIQAVSDPWRGLIGNIGTFGLDYAVLDLIGGIVLVLLSYPIAAFASKFSVDEASASRSGGSPRVRRLLVWLIAALVGLALLVAIFNAVSKGAP